jgi:hypothetical protein
MTHLFYQKFFLSSFNGWDYNKKWKEIMKWKYIKLGGYWFWLDSWSIDYSYEFYNYELINLFLILACILSITILAAS